MRTALFLSVLTLLYLYLGRRIVDLSAPLREGPSSIASLRLRRIVAWGGVGLSFLLLVGSQVLYRRLELPPETPGFTLLSWVAYFLAGFLVSILCVILPVDVLRLAGFVLWNFYASIFRLLKRPPVRVDFSARARRAWRIACGGSRWALLAFATIGSLAGLVMTLQGPRVTSIRIPHPGLPGSLEGFRVVQITDLHIGPTVLRGDVEKIVGQVNAQEPDVIVMTGDLIDGFVPQLRKHTEPLSRLKAKYGVFAVTGNHEYYWGAPAWMDEMERLGMRVLTDEHRLLSVGAGKVLIGGVPDQDAWRFLSSHESSPAKSLQGSPASDYRILMAHRPGSCFQAEKAGYDLQLSGHTHGGQFVPWSFYVPFAHPFTRGLGRLGKMWIYVSSGTEYWGPPNRFGIPSEISVFTLTAGN